MFKNEKTWYENIIRGSDGKLKRRHLSVPDGIIEFTPPDGEIKSVVMDSSGSGDYNSWWPYHPEQIKEEPKIVEIKCECGQSKVVQSNEEDDPYLHQRWCPKFQENK